MPMDFLRRIENSTFPLELEDETEVRNSIVLEAAGLIEAQLPLVETPSCDARAVILRITAEGRAAISKSKLA